MRHAWLGVLMCVSFGCSEAPVQPPTDASAEPTGTSNPDAMSPAPDAGPRLLPHDNVTVPQIALGVVYVGDVDAGGPPANNPMLQWLVGSPYWLWLDEYGIQNGTLAGSVRIPTSTLIQSGDVDGNGLVDIVILQVRIAAALHVDPDAGIASAISIPGANAFLFYLPDGVNVALGHRGTYVYQTCIDANGYHAFDGTEPYAVMPPCDDGRTLYAASHELAELVTDPQPYNGWVSDIDVAKNGGEVADLCAEKVMQEGVIVTRLWSNASNGCVP